MTHAALTVGMPAPDFALATQEGKMKRLADCSGKTLVLYFYPKDDTPGCTVEAKDFRDRMQEFADAGAVILGVSRDSLASHAAFQKKYCLPFLLGADEDGSVCEAYGVWVEKSMYGKKYMGIQRATFLIDGKGVLQKIWPKVSVEGHAQAVLDAVQALTR